MTVPPKPPGKRDLSVPIVNWTNQEQFTVTHEMLYLQWNGRGRAAFACGLCNHYFEVGDKARWFMARKTPNPLVCETCDGPDVQDRWEKHWFEVIRPILDHWGHYE